MNMTEYLQLLKQELADLPLELQEKVMVQYQAKFSQAAASGISEEMAAAAMASPRIVAANERAALRYRNLKRGFGIGNFFAFLLALFGLFFLNLFMLVPAFLYGMALFFAHLLSAIVYISGIVLLALSLSGVQQMSFKLPEGHQHWNQHNRHVTYQDHTSAVTIDVNEKGLSVEQTTVREGIARSVDNVISQVGDHVLQDGANLTIKNQTSTRHVFLGLFLLVFGTFLQLSCFYLNRMTWIGFGKYLSWNFSMLKAPFAA